MRNPYEVLGIKETVSIEDMLGELKDRISKFNRLKSDNNKLFQEILKNGFGYSGKISQLSELSIENALADQFACGITPNSKFMSYTELANICALFEEQKNSNGVNAKFYQNVISSQSQKLMKEAEIYQNIVDSYVENENSAENKEKLVDLYMKMKYEEAVERVGMSISSSIYRVDSAKRNKDNFRKELLKNKEYSEIEEAYEKLENQSSREDLVPELYVLSRMGDKSQFSVIDQDFRQSIINREKRFKAEYLKQSIKNFEGERIEGPLLQKHEYGWGMILTKPKIVLKGIEVNNSDFKGKVSVKHLGVFSADSFFSDRKKLKKKHEKIKLEKGEVEIDGKKHILSLRKHISKKRVPQNMREYLYRYEATKQLYNNIYIVKKESQNGNIREDIVFSPVGRSEFEKYPEEFFTNIYFSDYALDVARQNGGFAGAVIETPQGPTISTQYNEDEIASCILYQNGSEGKVIDKSENGKKTKPVRYMDKQEIESYLRYGIIERER